MKKNEGQGAVPTVWGAIAKEWEGKGAVYFDEASEGWLSPPNPFYYHGGYAPQAFDPDAEKKLWGVTLQLTDLSE